MILEVGERPAVVDDPVERHREVGRDGVVVARLLHDDPGGHVRNVDQHGGRVAGIPERLEHLLGDLDELGSPGRLQGQLAHGGILRARAGGPRLLPRGSRPVPHRARPRRTTGTSPGSKATLELEPVYERFADLATVEACEALRQAAAGAPPRSAPVELWRFACEGHLGSVTRAQEERLAELETQLEATVDGEHGRLPDAAADARERARPGPARAARARPRRARRRAPARLPRRARGGQAAAPDARRRHRPRPLRELRPRARAAGGAVPGRPRRHGGPLRRRVRPAAARPRRRVARRRPPLGRPAPLPRRGLGRRLPGRPDGAGPRRNARRARRRPARRSETSSSTSRSARRSRHARSAPRSRCRAGSCS